MLLHMYTTNQFTMFSVKNNSIKIKYITYNKLILYITQVAI